MTTLVIDDAKVMRNIIANCIKENYRGDTDIIEAADGEEALERMLSDKVDLVFVDWNMPKMDGIEFTKKIRSTDQFKHIPLIMITSEAARYMVVEAVKAGVTDYIIKPVVGKKLWEKIAKFFPEG